MSASKKISTIENQVAASNDNAGLHLVSFKQLDEMKLPERRAILSPWLLERQRCMVFAPTGLGKSFFVTSLALAIAGGGGVFGWKAEAPRKVLIVDGEMDMADIKDRLRPQLETIDGGDHKTALLNVILLARHNQDAETRFPDLAAPEGQRVLLKLIEKEQPALVILDNASTLFRLEDENAATAMDPIIDLMNAIRARDCATLLVHHSDKHGKSYRGSSKMAATFETIIGLRKQGVQYSEGAAFSIVWEKSRSANIATGSSMVTRLVRDERGKHSWKTEAVRMQLLAELVSLVKSRKFVTQDEIAAHLEVPASRISERKWEAITAGLISEDEWKASLRAAGEIRFNEDGDQEQSDDCN